MDAPFHDLRPARFGWLCVTGAVAANVALLTHTGPLLELPTYPLVWLARHLSADVQLSALLHYLASTWTRLFWLVGVLIWGICGLRPGDLGLKRGQWKTGLKTTLILALIIEALLAGVAWVGEGRLRWNPLGRQLSWGSWLALGMYYFLGVALFEELFYRGFLVPQMAHLFQKRFPRRGLLGAVLLSQALFALSHLPHYGMPFPKPVGLLILWFSGVILAWGWLRTGNLFIVIGWHGLMDWPIHLVATPANVPEGVTYLVGLVLLIGWPWLRPKRRDG